MVLKQPFRIFDFSSTPKVAQSGVAKEPWVTEHACGVGRCTAAPVSPQLQLTPCRLRSHAHTQPPHSSLQSCEGFRVVLRAYIVYGGD